MAAILQRSPFRLAAETNSPAACAPHKGLLVLPGKEQKLAHFFLTKAQGALFSLFCDKRIPQARGVLPGSGSSRSLVRFDDWIGFCLVPKELEIFDSLVVDSEYRNPSMDIKVSKH